MTIKPKTICNYSELDEILEQAIEWQERARQNHGITLSIKDCVKISICNNKNTAFIKINESLKDLLKIANAG